MQSHVIPRPLRNQHLETNQVVHHASVDDDTKSECGMVEGGIPIDAEFGTAGEIIGPAELAHFTVCPVCGP